MNGGTRFNLPDDADDSARVSKPAAFYDSVLAANPDITLSLVQVAAEVIAGPICERLRVAGVRWDVGKDKYVFSRGSDAKVLKDRWAGGLRSAVARRDGALVDRIGAVEAAVRLAASHGHNRTAVLAAVERGMRQQP
ncbi:hypothetical protein [Nocardioides aquaticus]|uniref:hypothetical protein n=1 Tax=Nocardioides aquaticus TaxID=160826 RepID=UPI001BD68F5A|nr:hypothetical protein [Nocardioides aquaticus]